MNLKDPGAIEQKSMEIISRKLGDRVPAGIEGEIMRRIVHTTADFALVDQIVISDDAVTAGLAALRAGATIITDVNMVRAGIRTQRLAELGGQAVCYITDEDVRLRAEQEGTTRAIMAIRRAAIEQGRKIFVIGNAPTALFELIRMVWAGELRAELIIGTPVGFVGAKEAKEELLGLDLPYVTLRGRRGGSAIAAAVVNALLGNT